MTLSDEHVAHVENTERELNQFIARRTRGSTAATERAKLWRKSEERYLEKKHRQAQDAAYAVEINLCECLERLARQHEERAVWLLEDPES